jgi:CO dehydrogenase/acetyl-CoA synthase epsilon subunit
MAKDNFDILSQLGDEKKVNELKAKIEKKKSIDYVSALDDIEKKIESSADSKSGEEIAKEIIDSNFENLNGNVQ